MRRAYAAIGRDNTLAYASRIKRHGRRRLEYARAGFFGECRKPERIVVRINVKGLPVMNRVEISRAAQLLPDPFRRPEFDVGTDPAHAFGFGA